MYSSSYHDAYDGYIGNIGHSDYDFSLHVNEFDGDDNTYYHSYDPVFGISKAKAKKKKAKKKKVAKKAKKGAKGKKLPPKKAVPVAVPPGTPPVGPQTPMTTVPTTAITTPVLLGPGVQVPPGAIPIALPPGLVSGLPIGTTVALLQPGSSIPTSLQLQNSGIVPILFGPGQDPTGAIATLPLPPQSLTSGGGSIPNRSTLGLLPESSVRSLSLDSLLQVPTPVLLGPGVPVPPGSIQLNVSLPYGVIPGSSLVALPAGAPLPTAANNMLYASQIGITFPSVPGGPQDNIPSTNPIPAFFPPNTIIPQGGTMVQLPTQLASRVSLVLMPAGSPRPTGSLTPGSLFSNIGGEYGASVCPPCVPIQQMSTMPVITT